MGFNTLANGWEYYSISEELRVFSDELFGFLSGLAPGWFALVFTVFLCFFVVYVTIYIKSYLQTIHKQTGGF